MMSFQIGDCVELKSGGPAMTIARLESQMGVLRATASGSIDTEPYSSISIR